MSTEIADIRKRGHMVARQAGAKTVQEYMGLKKGVIQSVLPKHMTPDRLMRTAFNALRTTPKLQDCTVESLVGATLQAAIMGLEPNTPLGHGWLIPYREKRGNEWVTNVQFQPGYQGVMELVQRSGRVDAINWGVVCENDEWRMQRGLHEQLDHIEARGDRGKAIAYYVIAWVKGSNRPTWEWMWVEDVEAHRDQYSKGAYYQGKPNRGHPWWTNFDSMALKTVFLKLQKRLPKSLELATLAEFDRATGDERGQGMDTVISSLEAKEDHIIPSSLPAPEEEQEPVRMQEQEPQQSNVTTFNAAGDKAPEQTQGPQPKEEGGHLLDTRRVIWDEELHSKGKSMKANGSWRLQKGVTPEMAQAGERMLMSDDTGELVNYHEYMLHGPGAPAPQQHAEEPKPPANAGSGGTGEDLDPDW